MMLQVIDYSLVCGFLLLLMKANDRVLLTCAVFSQDILPGVELAIEASESINGPHASYLQEDIPLDS